jgi:negative regulator of flagellin synthesis FlgM
MTNIISYLGRMAQPDSVRQTASRDEPRSTATDAAPAPMSAAPPRGGEDRVQLSDIARGLSREPEFDRAKVDAIRTALQQGQYPLDSRRIAESFVAIERMLKG